MSLIQPGQAVPELQPLARSHSATQLERDIQEAIIEVFEDLLRPKEREINALGIPHVGPFELVERNIKRDGLALFRGADEDQMRYLYKAWRARNPRRGIGFLKAYLQLLFPNNFTVHQQWQDKAQPYPDALQNTDGGNHFLTSRVRVQFDEDQDIDEVLAVTAALRSVIPARIFLSVFFASDSFNALVGVANGAAGRLVGRFAGNVGA